MTTHKIQELFEAVIKRKFGNNICFLCGCIITKENRSDEHVIPLWAQNRYHLLNQKIFLLNGTEIPYRKLTIPCCSTCNNDLLQPIETEVSQAVLKWPKAVEKIGNKKLFIWLGKIFYGLLYKELFLKQELSNQDSKFIMNPDILKEYQMLHYFLQSVRIPMQFNDFFPASIMLYETQAPTDPKMQWDFHDELSRYFIGCRMGTVGIVSVLMDGGAQKNFLHFIKDEYVKGKALHPLQFRELMSMTIYKALLFNRTSTYLLFEGKAIQVIQAPLGGLSRKPLYDDWHPETYAKILSQLTGIPLNVVFKPPDKVISWLRKKMFFDKFQWPNKHISSKWH